jgi:hypothetical protein
MASVREATRQLQTITAPLPRLFGELSSTLHRHEYSPSGSTTVGDSEMDDNPSSVGSFDTATQGVNNSPTFTSQSNQASVPFRHDSRINGDGHPVNSGGIADTVMDR